MALLIGNSNYQRNPLRCSRNDVKSLTQRLQRLNFKTISLVDLTFSQLINAVDYFCSLLGKGMYAIFYYSGHGVEVNKTTYFVPIDADEKNLQCNNSDLIAYKLQSTLAKVIMILDCCRKVYELFALICVMFYQLLIHAHACVHTHTHTNTHVCMHTIVTDIKITFGTTIMGYGTQYNC